MEIKKKIQTKEAKFGSTFGNYLPKFIISLATIFFVIWTVIGLLVFLVILQGLKQGAFQGLVGKQNNGGPQQTETSRSKTADLPGIGKVDVACVQQAVSQESIGKVLDAQDTSVLEGEEKTNFEACILENEVPTPTASPKNQS